MLQTGQPPAARAGGPAISGQPPKGWPAIRRAPFSGSGIRLRLVPATLPGFNLIGHVRPPFPTRKLKNFQIDSRESEPPGNPSRLGTSGAGISGTGTRSLPTATSPRACWHAPAGEVEATLQEHVRPRRRAVAPVHAGWGFRKRYRCYSALPQAGSISSINLYTSVHDGSLFMWCCFARSTAVSRLAKSFRQSA